MAGDRSAQREGRLAPQQPGAETISGHHGFEAAEASQAAQASVGRHKGLAAEQPAAEAGAGHGSGEAALSTTANPEFALAVEVLYHGDRQAFLSGAERWATFLTILGGSGAIGFGPIWAKLAGAAVAAIGAAQLSFAFTARAQQHADCKRRYLDLAADFKAGRLQPGEFDVRWLAISADEPTRYMRAERAAYERACYSLGVERSGVDLTPWRRRLRHLSRG